MEDKLSINPWLNIWIKPRRTIKEIVSYNPNYRLFFLSAIYGFTSLLGFAQSFSFGYFLKWPIIFLGAILLAPFWGYIIFSFVAWIVKVTGRWIGGIGSFLHIRTALAWSNVPLIINVFFWIILLIVFRQNLFVEFPGRKLFHGWEVTFFLCLALLQIVVVIWSLVIYLNALSQVQEFSILKAILNVLIAGIVFFVFFFLFCSLISWIGNIVFQYTYITAGGG